MDLPEGNETENNGHMGTPTLKINSQRMVKSVLKGPIEVETKRTISKPDETLVRNRIATVSPCVNAPHPNDRISNIFDAHVWFENATASVGRSQLIIDEVRTDITFKVKKINFGFFGNYRSDPLI